MAKVIRSGLRGVQFENRKVPYYLRVDLRNAGSQLGFVDKVDQENSILTLRRPQHNFKGFGVRWLDSTNGKYGGRFVEEDGTTRFDDYHYPPNFHQLSIDEKTEVIGLDLQVSGTGIAAVEAITGQPVLYQPERKRQRVELLPEGYGDWDNLITNNKQFLKGKELRFSVMGVMTSNEWDMNPFPQIDPKTGEQKRKPSGSRAQHTRSYHMYRLAGISSHGEDFGKGGEGMYQVPFNPKQCPIMDGFYLWTRIFIRPSDDAPEIMSCRTLDAAVPSSTRSCSVQSILLRGASLPL